MNVQRGDNEVNVINLTGKPLIFPDGTVLNAEGTVGGYKPTTVVSDTRLFGAMVVAQFWAFASDAERRANLSGSARGCVDVLGYNRYATGLRSGWVY